MPARYEIRVASTVLSGPLDQGSLHVMLDRVRALGLELVDVRQVLSADPDATD